MGDKAIDRVSNADLFERPDFFSNSIAIIVTSFKRQYDISLD
ncbi:hypothetical protein [Aquimarina intermedia]|nr:hypothetical protein [Aquimarina intermedia]